MTLLTIFDQDGCLEFKLLLNQLRPLVESYTTHKQKAQIERMMIIGKICEYKKKFPQRSKEHKTLNQAMYEEGWSKNVIHSSLYAYKTYTEVIEEYASCYHPVVKKATVSQLETIRRYEIDFYALLMYLRRNKKLPPVSAMRGYAAGYFDNTFQPLSRFRNRANETRETKKKTDYLEVRKLPASKDNQVYIGHTQSYVRDQYLYFLDQLDMNECFVNDEFKDELKKGQRQHKQELLEDWSRSTPQRIKHAVPN